MAEKGYVSLDAAYDIGTLEDWYISSVSQDDAPVWTEEHLEELLNDFYVIPKDTPTVDVAPVKHGELESYIHGRFYGTDKDGEPIFRDGIVYYCSECRRRSVIKTKFCPDCGAKMDGGENL